MQRLTPLWRAGRFAPRPLAQYQVRTARNLLWKWRRRPPGPRWQVGMPNPNVPTIELPNLVLDLDAEDNPHVQVYNEDIEDELDFQWRRSPRLAALRGRLNKFAGEIDEINSRLDSLTLEDKRPWRVSDRDILSVALLGTPEQEMETLGSFEEPSSQPPGQGREINAPYMAETAELLYENAVPPHANYSRSSTIHFLQHRQSLVGDEEFSDSSHFAAALQNARSVSEIRRLVVQATRTAKGCQIVRDSEVAIVHGLLPYLEQSLSKTYDNEVREDISALLLNLACNLARKNITVGENMCHLGLRVASSTLEPSGIRKWLDMGLKAGYLRADGHEQASDAVSAALSEMLQALCRLDVPGVSEAGTCSRFRGMRAELFSLLTGRSLADGETTQNSFRMLLEDDSIRSSTARGLYLAILAELGALRTLWAESRSWNAPPAAWQDAAVTAVLRRAAYAQRMKAGHAMLNARAGAAEAGQQPAADFLDLQTITFEDVGLIDTETGAPLVLDRPVMHSLDPDFTGKVAEIFSRTEIEGVMAGVGSLRSKITQREEGV